MKFLVRTSWWVAALHVGGLGFPAHAASTTGSPVELPPIMVEESAASVPWLYVNVGGTEFLSRCSSSTTRELVRAWLNQLQLMQVLVPEEFLAKMDTPTVFVLYAQDLDQTVSVEIQRELQEAQKGDKRKGIGSRENEANIAPSMRLADRDMDATISYVDESQFEGANLRISSSHVRYLLAGRVPELPPWLVEGVERTWRRTDFVTDPITLHPMIWLDQEESDALADDPTHPRALLPPNELFATGILRATENRHPRHARIRAAQQELFFRWAVVSGDETRAALWKFAARAATAPVTEEMFETCFGFGFSELRDRLSDYLPKAVQDEEWLDPGKQAPLPRVEVKRATPNQIARVRGEWERLAIGYVYRRLPQVCEPYIAQARRTLRRAFHAGDRDPRLLATMGLCEIDAGNERDAREYLEPAVAAGVVRPRAYYELARLRLAELRRAEPEKKLFSFPELAPVFHSLQGALMQAPPLPEAFTLLGDAWACCDGTPNTPEFAELERGSRLFSRRPTVAYPIALALAKHGKKARASAVLDACAGEATDDKTQAGITRLRAELKEEAPPSANTQ